MELTLTKNDFIEREGRYWMPSKTLGIKLGYAHPKQKISDLFKRYKDELESFSVMIKIGSGTKESKGVPKLGTPSENEQETRVFDEQGCYIIAMLSRTAKAKAFRKALSAFMVRLRQHPGAAAKASAELKKLLAAKKAQRIEFAALELEIMQRKYPALTKRVTESLAHLYATGHISHERLGLAFGLPVGVVRKVIGYYSEAFGAPVSVEIPLQIPAPLLPETVH